MGGRAGPEEQLRLESRSGKVLVSFLLSWTDSWKQTWSRKVFEFSSREYSGGVWK